VSVEPQDLNGDATVVDLDGEWYVQWSPSVSAGDEAELTYTVGETADFEITVEGIEDEKLTLNA